MKIDTKYFGNLEIDATEVVEFRSPIYGFENLRRFTFLYDDSVPGPFTWMQSLEAPDVCFILVDPSAVVTGYAPELPQETQKLLELDEAAPVWRAIAVVPRDLADATMNLKSPVVINPARKCAAQVILEADYPLRAKLMGGDAPC